MNISHKQLAGLFVNACDGATDKKIEEAAHAFVALLVEKGLVQDWRKIENEIHGIWKEKYGASKISIVSAHPLSKELHEAIEKKANGAQIIERVDARLLGGAIMRIDDTRIDGTISGKLRRLKTALMQSI
ncbi:MAG: F0F1 ATP synthase subunit delta [Patescibacteria group bacterium]|jgi:ATP synthase F1 delta subunit